jgi:hypothetical protein
METVLWVLGIAIIVAISFLFGHYILGIGLFRLSDIERIAPDIGGHGFHVFGSFRSSDPSDNFNLSEWRQQWHVFVRLSDGRIFRSQILEHRNEFKRGAAGYVDGFKGFETEIWDKKRYDESLASLSDKTGLALAVDRQRSFEVKLHVDDPPKTHTANDGTLTISRSINDYNYVLYYSGATKWRAKV